MGSCVTAVDQSAAMCAFLAAKAGAISSYQVVHSQFEELPPAVQEYDLAMCGTAFHWLDPYSRVSRIASMVKDGGSLCLAWHIFEEDAACRTIRDGLDECCPALEIERSPAHGPLEVFRNAENEVVATGEFAVAGVKEWIRARSYGQDDLIRLLLTYTGIRALPEVEISALKGRLLETLGARTTVSFRIKALLFRKVKGSQTAQAQP